MYVDGDVVDSRKRKDRITIAWLNKLKERIQKELGVRIEWAITSGIRVSWEVMSVQVALMLAMKSKFDDFVRSVVISPLNMNPVIVWVAISDSSNTLLGKNHIDTAVNDFFEALGRKKPKIVLVSDMSLPTEFKLLRIIKVHSPICIEMLGDIIWGKDADSDKQKWLQRKLDSLRKQSKLVRSKEGLYFPTIDALSVVGIGTGASSSDVARALEIGRRRW